MRIRQAITLSHSKTDMTKKVLETYMTSKNL